MEIASPNAISEKNSLLLACLLALLSQLPGSVVAQGERDPLGNAPEPRASWQWSGNFQLGYATMQSTDQLSAELVNSITQDIHIFRGKSGKARLYRIEVPPCRSMIFSTATRKLTLKTM